MKCILVNDSDIRVQPDYLRRVTAPLLDPKIGLVTCLYRGVRQSALWDRVWNRLASARIFPPECWLRGNSKAASILDSVPRSPFAGPILRPSAVSKRWWIIWPTITKSADALPRKD